MKRRDEDDHIRLIRDHGLQVTFQRLAVYRALASNNGHPSADAIYQGIKKKYPMISLGTVYKTLERFEEAGLIQKIGYVSGVVRYDAAVGDHHHFVCIKCREITDVEHVMPFPLISGSHIVSHQVFFHGYCRECYPQSHGNSCSGLARNSSGAKYRYQPPQAQSRG